MCRLYRVGYRLPDENSIAVFENTIVGLLYTQANDPKVRRWAINAIAQIGREFQCKDALIHIMETFHSDPDTLAAVVSAIYKICAKVPDAMKRLGLSEQMTVLAALQHVSPVNLDLSCLPINVDRGSPELLRLGLLLVGFDKSSPKLFDPNHSNQAMVRVLGGHHDPVVQQYSVWAISENTNLGLRDLGIPLSSIEGQPANVRSWLYRLTASAVDDAVRHFDVVELGASDPNAEARAGLALGLRGTYFDGLDAVVVDWFSKEEDQDVRESLLDHIVKYSAENDSYLEWACQIYDREPSSSRVRLRMEMSAARTPTFATFKRRQFTQQPDMFINGGSMPTINVGSIQAGSVALGGNSNVEGGVTVTYDQGKRDAVQETISAIERQINSSVSESPERTEALAALHSARIEPTPAKITTVCRLVSAVAKVPSLISDGGTIISAAQALLQLAGLSN